MIQKMEENDLLAELNFDNIPNIKNIDPQYMEMSKQFDPENKYSVPYTWGPSVFFIIRSSSKKKTSGSDQMVRSLESGL